MASASERLLAQIRALPPEDLPIPIPEDAVVRRTYASRSGRVAGAWSWSVETGRPWAYGSQWPVSVVLRCKNWDVVPDRGQAGGDVHITPCRECMTRHLKEKN